MILLFFIFGAEVLTRGEYQHSSKHTAAAVFYQERPTVGIASANSVDEAVSFLDMLKEEVDRSGPEITKGTFSVMGAKAFDTGTIGVLLVYYPISDAKHKMKVFIAGRKSLADVNPIDLQYFFDLFDRREVIFSESLEKNRRVKIEDEEVQALAALVPSVLQPAKPNPVVLQDPRSDDNLGIGDLQLTGVTTLQINTVSLASSELRGISGSAGSATVALVGQPCLSSLANGPVLPQAATASVSPERGINMFQTPVSSPVVSPGWSDQRLKTIGLIDLVSDEFDEFERKKQTMRDPNDKTLVVACITSSVALEERLPLLKKINAAGNENVSVEVLVAQLNSMLARGVLIWKAGLFGMGKSVEFKPNPGFA
ncbi:MAG: hypothetical protein AAB323_02160 [Pseudomonadota bacterium]